MRDFTLYNYIDTFWLNELSKLKSKRSVSCNNLPSNDTYLTVFGTIIEIKKGDDKFILYLVDDGSGVIVCRHTINSSWTDEIEEWNGQSIITEDNSIAGESEIEPSTLCDTVFNDDILQQTERNTLAVARMEMLESIRWKILERCLSFKSYKIGDIVCIHGKLYSYFGANQIYVNTIRQISMEEEMALMMKKLDDKESIKMTNSLSTNVPALNSIDTSDDVNCNLDKKPVSFSIGSGMSSRASGIMTFDTIEDSRCSIIRVPPPPSPVLQPGLLSLNEPSTSKPLSTFDTFSKLDETNESDDDIILPTPPKNLKKTLRK